MSKIRRRSIDSVCVTPPFYTYLTAFPWARKDGSHGHQETRKAGQERALPYLWQGHSSSNRLVGGVGLTAPLLAGAPRRDATRRAEG